MFYLKQHSTELSIPDKKHICSSIIIFGSARLNGNTKKAVESIVHGKEIPLIDLNELNIKPYDYNFKNQDDDFIPTIEKALQYDTIIFATPVYWYSMSGVMKKFIDRFTDLLYLRKDLGKRLKGKNLFLVTSFGSGYPKEILSAFEKFAGYLKMNYLGHAAIFSETYNKDLLENNKTEILNAAKVLGIK